MKKLQTKFLLGLLIVMTFVLTSGCSSNKDKYIPVDGENSKVEKTTEKVDIYSIDITLNGQTISDWSTLSSLRHSFIVGKSYTDQKVYYWCYVQSDGGKMLKKFDAETTKIVDIEKNAKPYFETINTKKFLRVKNRVSAYGIVVYTDFYDKEWLYQPFENGYICTEDKTAETLYLPKDIIEYELNGKLPFNQNKDKE